MTRKISILELIKRTSKGQEKSKLFESALNFGQWKTFCENYKPMRRLIMATVCKFTENNCHWRFFFDFIQAQKRYTTSLDKIVILT